MLRYRTIALLAILHAFAALAQRPSVAPRPIAPVPYAISSAATAFAGDRFLTVWPHVKRHDEMHVVGVFSDAEGKRFSPAAFMIVPDVEAPENVSLHLVAMDDGYALFWKDRLEIGHLAEIDLEGAARSHVIIPKSAADAQTFAWNGRHFIGVMTGQEALAVLFERDGTLVAQTPLPRRNVHRDVVPFGDGFVVFAGGDFGVTAHRIGASGMSTLMHLDEPTFGLAAADAGDGVLLVWINRFGMMHSVRVSANGEAGAVHELEQNRWPMTLLDLVRAHGGFRLVVAAHTAADGYHLRTLHLDDDGALRGSTRGETYQAPYGASGAHVASNADVTLIAAYDERPMRGIAVRNDGTSRSHVLAIAPAMQTHPLAAATGGQFLVTWLEHRSPRLARAAVVDAAARTTRDATAATTDATSVADRLAWNGDTALLVTSDGARITATRITRNGAPIDAAPIAIATLRSPGFYSPAPVTVTWHIDRWVVGWIDEWKVYTAEVEPSGGVRAPRLFRNPVRPPSPHLSDFTSVASLMSNGRELLLVWYTGTTYAARLDEHGQARDWPVRVAGFIAVPAPATASSGEEILLLDGFRVWILRTDGDVLFADGPRLLLDHINTTSADLTWDGSEYVAAVRYGVDGTSVARIRLDRNALPAAPMTYTRINEPEARSPRIAVAAEEGLGAIIAVHEKLPGADTAHVTVIHERTFEPLPPPPPAPQLRLQPVAQPFVRVVWDPVPGADGYLYESLSYRGEWERHVLADGRTWIDVTHHSEVRIRAFNAGGLSAAVDVEARPERRRSASARP